MSDEKRLRILVVGASGVLGGAVVRELKPRHEIIAAGSKSGAIRIDIADPASIVAGLAAAGPLDAIACAAGAATFAPLSAFTPASVTDSAYGLGLASKLMGQVNLTLAARDVLRDGGLLYLEPRCLRALDPDLLVVHDDVDQVLNLGLCGAGHLVPL